MGKCFVIQPFDRGVFDKRYDDVYAPAIKNAGLEPYRVDRDPSVNIPIEEIESGIRRSKICLAEITTDNPNVWFELGFAIAVPIEVVLICSEEREANFPFDVQHRNIIKYKNESRQDFDKLQNDISQRILAIINKQKQIDKVSKLSPIRETEGLSQHEIVALVTVMQNSYISMTGVSGYKIKEDMNDAGFTDISISLALKTLKEKKMVVLEMVQDEDGPEYLSYAVTYKGEQWLVDNQDKLVLRYEIKDDIPF